MGRRGKTDPQSRPYRRWGENLDTGTHSEVGSPKKITKKFKLDPGRIAQDLQDTGVGRSGREKSVLGKETRFFSNFLLKNEVQP